MSSPETLLPGPTPRRQFRWSVLLAIAVFFGTRLYCYFYLAPSFTDLYLYVTYAVNGVDLDQTPYLDFPFEYPPAAYCVIAFPRWIASEKLTRDDLKDQPQLDVAVKNYFRAFRTEMFLCDLIAFGLFLATVLRRRSEFAGSAGVSYALSTGILHEVLYDRFDAGLLFLLTLWAFLTVSSWRENASRLGWTLASYAVLGLGVAYKLIPVVAFPLLALADLKSLRAARETPRLLVWLAFAAGSVLPFMAAFIIAGPKSLDFLKYHGERGIEIESIHASVLIVLSWFNVPIRALHDYGCWNVETLGSDLSQILAAASTWLILIAILAALVWFCFQPRSHAHVTGYRLAIWVILAAVTLAKVLSVQYLIWLLPLLLLLGIETCNRWEFAALLCITVLLALLTAWVFPYHFTPDYIAGGIHRFNEPDYALIPDLGYWPCLALVVRNLLLLNVVAWLGWKTATAKFATAE
jgi:hypothetical protein